MFHGVARLGHLKSWSATWKLKASEFQEYYSAIAVLWLDENNVRVTHWYIRQRLGRTIRCSSVSNNSMEVTKLRNVAFSLVGDMIRWNIIHIYLYTCFCDTILLSQGGSKIVSEGSCLKAQFLSLKSQSCCFSSMFLINCFTLHLQQHQKTNSQYDRNYFEDLKAVNNNNSQFLYPRTTPSGFSSFAHESTFWEISISFPWNELTEQRGWAHCIEKAPYCKVLLPEGNVFIYYWGCS